MVKTCALRTFPLPRRPRGSRLSRANLRLKLLLPEGLAAVQMRAFFTAKNSDKK
jgi:hypothetical protein